MIGVLHQQMRNWWEARSICELSGMKIVAIENQMENRLLEKHIICLMTSSPIYFWTSGRYNKPAKKFTWYKNELENEWDQPDVDGPAYNYTNWDDGYPRTNVSEMAGCQGILLFCHGGYWCRWAHADCEKFYASFICDAQLMPNYTMSKNQKTRQVIMFDPNADAHQLNNTTAGIPQALDTTIVKPVDSNISSGAIVCWISPRTFLVLVTLYVIFFLF